MAVKQTDAQMVQEVRNLVWTNRDTLGASAADAEHALTVLADVLTAREQEAELDALGGTGAAEAMWDAIKKHSPNWDGADTFADLAHKKKVEYAVMAKAACEFDADPYRR